MISAKTIINESSKVASAKPAIKGEFDWKGSSVDGIVDYTLRRGNAKLNYKTYYDGLHFLENTAKDFHKPDTAAVYKKILKAQEIIKGRMEKEYFPAGYKNRDVR